MRSCAEVQCVARRDRLSAPGWADILPRIRRAGWSARISVTRLGTQCSLTLIHHGSETRATAEICAPVSCHANPIRKKFRRPLPVIPDATAISPLSEEKIGPRPRVGIFSLGGPLRSSAARQKREKIHRIFTINLLTGKTGGTNRLWSLRRGTTSCCGQQRVNKF